MNITVLGGSPNGPVSVTMQYVEFLRTNFPEHTFKIRYPAHEISRLEKNPEYFREVIEDVRSADILLWAFPLYVFTVASQYQRFLELIEERSAGDAFKGKYAVTLSTSIRFFDHLAHRHMRAASEDLGMNFLGAYSCHMEDLMAKNPREQLLLFFEDIFKGASEGRRCGRDFAALADSGIGFTPGSGSVDRIKTGKKVTVVFDGPENGLASLLNSFSSVFETGVEVVDLAKVDIKGGCLGCLKCGQANRCNYEGKDGFIEMFERSIRPADIILFVLRMKGRSHSALWKKFLDRGFYNTHQRTLKGKQVAFIVSGRLSQAPHIQEYLTAYAEWQAANLNGILTDEFAPLDGSEIGMLARKMISASEAGLMQPASFLGYGGMKVFRDDIYSNLGVVFKADYRNYRKEKIYDFPQKKPFFLLATRLLYMITSIPWVYGKMIGNFKEFMLMPYKHIVGQRIRKQTSVQGQ